MNPGKRPRVSGAWAYYALLEGKDMRNVFSRFKIHIAIVGTFLLGFAAASIVQPLPARAGFDLGDLVNKGIKVAGVAVIVDQFGGEINKFINQFMDNNDAPLDAG